MRRLPATIAATLDVCAVIEKCALVALLRRLLKRLQTRNFLTVARSASREDACGMHASPNFFRCCSGGGIPDSPKRRAQLMAQLLCWLVPLLIAGNGFAQGGGELLWSVDLTYTPATAAPKVAPSGDIYIHSDDLYAISPAGADHLE
jgi:hypothetical protein